MFESTDTYQTATSREVLQPTLRTVAAVVVVGLSLLPLSLFIFSLLGRYFFLAELISNFRCPIMLLLSPCVLLLLLVRQWWWALVFAIATAWSMNGVVWIHFPAKQPPAGPEKIHLMSFNVHATNPTPHRALERILQYEPDVVAVIEYSDNFSTVLEGLNQKYPYHVLQPRWHGFGIAMFSKYPLIDSTIVPLAAGETDSPMIVSHAIIGQRKIRMVAIHVLSPTSRDRLEIRNQQLLEAAQMLSQSTEPTIVMGDFNCTPWSPFLNDFLEITGYRDSRQGFGYQPTWHRDLGIFKIPIDHAFVSDDIHIHDRFVGEEGGSDHLPIVFDVSISPK